MQILPVTGKKEEDKFLSVADDLYANDPDWIKPLNKDIINTFDPARNKAFRFGKTSRWILLGDNNKTIGRIAAFINSRYKNKGDEFPVGGIGFFECINNQQAADMLFDKAAQWLQQEGMKAMDGPINFGERDRFWGLLTKGFQSPLYCMNYNPPYYKELFENYGFKPFYDQICLGMNPKEKLADKITSRHKAVSEDKNFSASHLDKSRLEKFAVDFATVYNKAWAGHGGLKQLSKEQVMIMFRQMKPVMDERIIWFAYYKNEPVAIFTNIPDLNQWFRHLNGKFGLWQKLRFLWLKKFKPNPKFVGLVFGVVPEWQGKGVDAYIIGEAQKLIGSPAIPYTQYEMQWIGDFNPKMLNVGEGLGNVSRTRILTTYRHIFDPALPFRRHPQLI